MLKKYKYHLWLHFIVLIWGFTGVLGKLLDNTGMDSSVIVIYRMMIGWISLLIFMLITKSSLKIDRRGLFKTIANGIVVSLHWFTFFKSIELSNVSFALIFMSTTALFTSLIEPILVKKKFDYRELLMGIVIVVGIAIIVNENLKYYNAMMFGLVSAFLAATFSVINSKLVQQYDSKTITLYEILGGSIAILAISIVSNEVTSNDFVLNWEQFGYLFVLGSVCTSFAFVMSVYLMKFISAYTVNISVNLEPIYAMILAVLIFKEAEVMTWRFYLGASIVLGTILVNAYIKSKIFKET